MSNYKFQIFDLHFIIKRTLWLHRVSITSVALLLLVLPCAARAELIDRVAAAVNYEVITWSDLEQAVRFNAAISGGSRDGERLRTETLEGLINRQLLIQEAGRLRFVEVSAQDISAEDESSGNGSGRTRSSRIFLPGWI
jgi:hypothetical protein